jgi:magnesium transporter
VATVAIKEEPARPNPGGTMPPRDRQPAQTALPLGDQVRIWAYVNHHLREDVPEEEISDLLAAPHNLVWIDLTAPAPGALERLRVECQLHPLAIEDAQGQHQRPKVDEYEAFYFVVFYVAQLDPRSGVIQTQEVDLFLGPNYLITLHQEPVSQIEESMTRWRRNAAELGDHLGALLYSLFDSMVDSYFPVLDHLGDQVDDVQEAIFAHPTRRTLQSLSQLRRDLLAIRRVLAPEREVINTLIRRDRPILATSTIVYFHDIYDHVVRLIDTVDTYRDLLGTATDSYLSVTSNNLNEVMKTLTGWSIILMSATLVAGIYGMNFVFMPELHWPFGYPIALAIMALIAGLLYRYFRRRGWL